MGILARRASRIYYIPRLPCEQVYNTIVERRSTTSGLLLKVITILHLVAPQFP